MVSIGGVTRSVRFEARAFQNADLNIRDVRWGCVLGLLNAGTVIGYSSRTASGRASDAIYHGMPVRGLGKMLTPQGPGARAGPAGEPESRR